MAFCNSCGATLDAGTKFCNKCGAVVPAASVPAVSTPAAAATPAQGGGSNAVKIILIVVAVIVGLGLVTAGLGAYFVHRAYVRVRDSAHIEEKNGKVKVESPFGNIETSTDPNEAARNIGVDIYPGAEVSKNGSASMTIGGMHTSSAVLETDDSPDKVAAFYKSKLPSSAYSSNQGDHYSMMAGDKDNMTTINIAGRDGKTVIEISRVTKASGSN
jgi:hypothetical protein